MASPLLTLRNARLHIGNQALFADLDLAIERDDRICLVGRNGAGKSTLLKAIAGLIELDAGERFLQPRTTVAYLPQEPELPAGATALGAVLAGLPRMDVEGAGDHLAEAALARFDIAPDHNVDQCSGGEARRIALARAMVSAPEILLLDEPTNHLDIDVIERLEHDLGGFHGAIVTISHDRRLLSALSKRVWWLDRGRVRRLDQSFDSFDGWSAEALANEEAELNRLSKAIDTETEWLHFGVTARRKRNQGRLRRLHTMRKERAERIRPEGRVKLDAASSARSGRLVIEAKGVGKSFGDQTIIDDFSTRIMRGDRVGIIGPNGASKTTLIHLLTGTMPPDRGMVRLGTELDIALIDQRRDGLDLNATPWQTLCPDGGDQVEVQGRWQHVVGYLRNSLFRPEQLRTPIRVLSGGERNRLLLAKQLLRPANLMVLDEPTNDLDMETLDLLQEMLTDFAGTLLLVSHDRDFLDRLVTSTIVFEGNGSLQEYAGGYSDYLMQRQRSPDDGRPQEAEAKAAKPAKPRRDREAGRQARKVERELTRLVEQIERWQAEKQVLEAGLADPALYARDPAAFQDRTDQLTALQQKIDQAEERWLALELE
ncbi:MAG: ABC-F family ATP-binding cassette domain-containing protein, partial [Geminicoccaceae bacterium]